MTHRSSGLAQANQGDKQGPTLSWESSQPLEVWLTSQPTDRWKENFERDGFLVVEDLLGEDEVRVFSDVYDKLLSGEIDTSTHRHDLGNHESARQEGKENICQIMWPSIFVNGMEKSPLHERANAVAKVILGEDMAFDFDMLIAKTAHTDTITPWHQDESYWPDMPDKRAVSCWCSVDHATLDNGCMWFVPGSHKLPIRPHGPVKPGVHVLTCPGSEDEGVYRELKPGSCTFHHGRTMHYTRGNKTNGQRRAYITNFRPNAMVEYERNQCAFDHGKAAGVHDILETGQGHVEA